MVAHKATAAEKSDSSNLGFTALDVIEDKLSPSAPRKESGWTVTQIIICSPEGEELELRSDNLLVVSKLLSKMTAYSQHRHSLCQLLYHTSNFKTR